MRLLMLALTLLLALAQYHLWFGKNGIHQNQEVAAEVELASASNAELKQRNQLMYSEIEDLKSGFSVIEERARNELGLIKEGETFFRIVPKED